MTRKLKEEHKPLAYSLGLHFAVLIFAIVRPYFSPEVKPFQRTIKVDIVAMPEKNQKIQKKTKLKTKKKSKITKKAKKKTTKTIAKASESSEAMEMEAFKKLQSLKDQKREEELIKNSLNKIKGNRVSKGTDLIGVEKIEYTNYKSRLHNSISANWDLPKWLLEGKFRALAEIKIDDQGNITYKKIVKSSGNTIYDEKVMEAIEEAAPFDPPPDKFRNIVLYEGVTLAFP